MLNRSASLAMSTSVLKALPGKLDIKRHSPRILFCIVSFAHVFAYTLASLSLDVMGWYLIHDCGVGNELLTMWHYDKCRLRRAVQPPFKHRN